MLLLQPLVASPVLWARRGGPSQGPAGGQNSSARLARFWQDLLPRTQLPAVGCCCPFLMPRRMPNLGSTGWPTSPAFFNSSANGDSGTATLRAVGVTECPCSPVGPSKVEGLKKPQIRTGICGSPEVVVQISAGPRSSG